MTRGVLAELRDLVPIRPLTREEALRLAEHQAQLFLVAVGVDRPAVPERVIAELPKFQVVRVSPLPVSGACHWSNGRWQILLNSAEPLVRQRFSLAHEFKHILDHRFIDVLYQAIPAHERAAFVEQVCDYFAGCLLIPRPWLRRAWREGIQSSPALAHRFGVSQAAINVRLQQVGLGQRPRRCGHGNSDWKLPIPQPPYQRAPSPLIS